MTMDTKRKLKYQNPLDGFRVITLEITEAINSCNKSDVIGSTIPGAFPADGDCDAPVKEYCYYTHENKISCS